MHKLSANCSSIQKQYDDELKPKRGRNFVNVLGFYFKQCRETVHKLSANCSSIQKQYDDELKPKRGRKFAFSMKDEIEMVDYTNFCWERNIPKTEDMLKPDVTYYLDVESMENRFKTGEPGIFSIYYLASLKELRQVS